MKKTILAMCCLVASCAIFAQNTNGDTSTSTTNGTDMNNTGNTLSSTGNYNAYSAPYLVQMDFARDYPSMTNVTWTPTGDWWTATYNQNGRYSRMYYNYRGEHYMVALPVTSTWIPDNVVSNAGNMFGGKIYDITELRGNNDQMIYQVRYINNNGMVTTDWLDANGAKTTYSNRTDDASMNNNMNNANSTDMNNQNSNVNNGSMNNAGNSSQVDMSERSTLTDMSSGSGTNNNRTGTITKKKTVKKNGHIKKKTVRKDASNSNLDNNQY